MSEPLDRAQLVKLTSDIVAAYVSSHQVAPAVLEGIIGSVAGSLAAVGHRPEPVAARPAPAVSVRRSIGRGHLICLVCGKKLKTIKRHLAMLLAPEQYRERFGLRSDYPMVAPSYAALRSEFARRTGLGQKPAPAVPAVAPRKRAPRGRSDQGQSWLPAPYLRCCGIPVPSHKKQRVLELRLFLGDHGATDRHDGGDDAVNPFGGLVLRA
jgi:predicted transcriptional regulator